MKYLFTILKRNASKIYYSALALIIFINNGFYLTCKDYVLDQVEPLIQENYELTQNTYFYNSYNDKEKDVYDTIYSGIKEHNEKISINKHGLSNDEIFDIYNTVYFDHPELFYNADNYFLCSTILGTYLNVEYRYSREETNEYQKQINDIVANYKEAIAGMDLSSTVEYTYRYVITHISYDYDAMDHHDKYKYCNNIVGGLIEGKGVCSCYAFTFQFLLNCAGYEVQSVYNEEHQWDALKVGDNYYYFDPTWDDPEFLDFVYYDYYCLTYDEISIDHECENFAFNDYVIY